MMTELSPLAASLLGRPLVSNSAPGTPCPVCKGLAGKGILSSKSPYTLVNQCPIPEFSQKCARGEACEVCSPSQLRLLGIKPRFNEMHKSLNVIIDKQTHTTQDNNSVKILKYHTLIPNLSTEWIIRDDNVHLVEADAMSDKAFDHVTRWMNHCAAHHGGCVRPDANFMPARLLDVGQGDAQHVRLVSGVAVGEYAALSHCWGTLRHIVTERATLREFHISLDMARLPRNVADAVRFTRRLGIRYLWIDSLCIIQDDEKDWAEESSKMASVYSNANMTIVASRAASSAEGFLGPREEIYVVKEEADESGKMQRYYVVNREWHNNDPARDSRNEPLSKRAWTVQERWLSRRAVIFTKDQMVWECDDMRSCESDPRAMLPREAASRSNFEDMVQRFTSYAITKEEDTFPAFAGVARAMAQVDKFSYCAGIRVESCIQDLLWYADSGKEARPEFVAPSFSWAASKGSVCYWGWVWGPHRRTKTLARYRNHGQTLKRGRVDPYGALESAWMGLCGPVVQATAVVNVKFKSKVILQVRLETGRETTLDGEFDHRAMYGDAVLKSGRVFALPMCVTAYPGKEREDSTDWDELIMEDECYLETLIVIRAESSVNEFRRIGICRTRLVNLIPRTKLPSWGVENWDDPAERKEAFLQFLNDTRGQMRDIVLI